MIFTHQYFKTAILSSLQSAKRNKNKPLQLHNLGFFESKVIPTVLQKNFKMDFKSLFSPLQAMGKFTFAVF